MSSEPTCCQNLHCIISLLRSTQRSYESPKAITSTEFSLIHPNKLTKLTITLNLSDFITTMLLDLCIEIHTHILKTKATLQA